MAVPFQFKAAEKQADAMLKADKAKVQWKRLPLAELPEDLRNAAHEAMVAECLARRAMLAFKELAEDKVDMPAGRRYIFAVERGVSDPNMLAEMLFAEVDAKQSQSQSVTWAQFTKAK